MNRRGHRGKVDRNHWEVFTAFKDRGWFVISTAEVGAGFPDLLIARGGDLLQIEVKDGRKSPSERKLSPLQELYHADLRAAGCPVLMVESVADVESIDAE